MQIFMQQISFNAVRLFKYKNLQHKNKPINSIVLNARWLLSGIVYHLQKYNCSEQRIKNIFQIKTNTHIQPKSCKYRVQSADWMEPHKHIYQNRFCLSLQLPPLMEGQAPWPDSIPNLVGVWCATNNSLAMAGLWFLQLDICHTSWCASLYLSGLLWCPIIRILPFLGVILIVKEF